LTILDRRLVIWNRRLTIGCREDPPLLGSRAKQAKQRRAREHRRDPLRVALDAEGHASRVVKRLLFEDADLAQPVVVVGHTRRPALDAGARIAVVHQHEALRLGHRQRPEEHGVDDGEYGGVCADAERERHNGRDGQRTVLPEQTQGKSQVLTEAFHRW
jgi:hypothetical protein